MGARASKCGSAAKSVDVTLRPQLGEWWYRIGWPPGWAREKEDGVWDWNCERGVKSLWEGESVIGSILDGRSVRDGVVVVVVVVV